MRRQRNNLVRLPFEVRETACRLLHEGRLTYRQIAGEIEKLSPGAKIHDTTLQAYQKSAEFADYVQSRRQWDEKLGKRRWAAQVLNDGKGPQSVADLAELAILEQLHALASGSLLETGKDVATVARAITALQRTQLARTESAKDAEIAALKAAAAEREAALTAQISDLGEQIATLKNGGKTVDATAVADRLNDVLGVKKT
jgi:hypothetical protein